jgi:hypothetical protein
VHGQYNRLQHAVNIERGFVTLFNEIREARRAARYPVPERPLKITIDDVRQRLGMAEDMHADLTSRLPARPPRGDRR